MTADQLHSLDEMLRNGSLDLGGDLQDQRLLLVEMLTGIGALHVFQDSRPSSPKARRPWPPQASFCAHTSSASDTPELPKRLRRADLSVVLGRVVPQWSQRSLPGR